MSVALLVSDPGSSAKRLVPVATQQVFVADWLPGARELDLTWVDLMETGFDVTAENRDELVGELEKLRTWMVDHAIAPYQVERLDMLVTELKSLHLESGATAFLG